MIVVETHDHGYVDERGEIKEILTAPIRTVLLITAKKGSVRANHYHKKDVHWTYVISGSMEYYEKRRRLPKIEMVVVKAGQMVFSASGVTHAMRFLEDSVFLALTTEPRYHESYENDTVRVKII